MNKWTILAFIVFIFSFSLFSETRVILESKDPVMGFITERTEYVFNENGRIAKILRYCRDIENYHDYSIAELNNIDLDKLFSKEEIIAEDSSLIHFIYDIDKNEKKVVKEFSLDTDSFIVQGVNGILQEVKVNEVEDKFAVITIKDDKEQYISYEVKRTANEIICMSNKFGYLYHYKFDDSGMIIEQLIEKKDGSWENEIQIEGDNTFVRYYYSPTSELPVEEIIVKGNFKYSTTYSAAINTMILKGSQISWLLPFVMMGNQVE